MSALSSYSRVPDEPLIPSSARCITTVKYLGPEQAGWIRWRCFARAQYPIVTFLRRLVSGGHTPVFSVMQHLPLIALLILAFFLFDSCRHRLVIQAVSCAVVVCCMLTALIATLFDYDMTDCLSTMLMTIVILTWCFHVVLTIALTCLGIECEFLVGVLICTLPTYPGMLACYVVLLLLFFLWELFFRLVHCRLRPLWTFRTRRHKALRSVRVAASDTLPTTTTYGTCMVCLQDIIITSEQPLAVMSCSGRHVVHLKCFAQAAGTEARCPVCSCLTDTGS